VKFAYNKSAQSDALTRGWLHPLDVGENMGWLLTNKGIFAEFKTQNIHLYDVLGNKHIESCVNKDPLEQLTSWNLEPCFSIEADGLESAKEINPQFTSVALSNEHFSATFQKWEDHYLNEFRKVEWIIGQVAYGKTYGRHELRLMEGFETNESLIRDCHLNSSDYEKLIGQWREQDPKVTLALQTQHEISRLGELVRFELAHAEARLLEAVTWIAKLIIDSNGRKKIENNDEYVSYGMIVDQIGWCVTDTVKSLSTSLDAASKYINLISSIVPNKKPKTKPMLAGHLQNFRPKGSLIDKESRTIVKNNYAKLKPLINLRHELTHNHVLYPIRQPAFVGKETDCINNISLAYAEILWWDKNGEGYSRNNGRTGFFSQRNNAIKEARDAFVSTIELVESIVLVAKRISLSTAKDNGINRITYLKMDNNSKAEYNVSEVEQLL